MSGHPLLPIGPESPWLAPLAGFSDLPFRLLCREQGCRVACTEMVSARGLTYRNETTGRILATNALDNPLVVQVYGADAQTLGQAMDLLLEKGATYFDLNCGCSVPKVAKTGSGAALLRTPNTLLEIVRVMVAKAGTGRVGVKLRLGWRPDEEVFLELGQRLEGIGVAWLTLHPRWATQGFSGQADWSRLAQLCGHVSIPIIASGDLFTAEDARRCLEQTGVQGIMFARGALWDPAIFRKFLALGPGGKPFRFSPEYCIGVVRRHMALAREHLNDRHALLTMRTIAPRYLRHFSGAKNFRSRLTMLDSWDELEAMLSNLSLDMDQHNPNELQ